MPFYGMPQDNVTAMDSMLQQIDDLDKSFASSNTNSMENQIDANSTLNTLKDLRRSSLLADCSAPINIPGKFLSNIKCPF